MMRQRRLRFDRGGGVVGMPSLKANAGPKTQELGCLVLVGGADYRRMIEGCAVGRAGTPDEVVHVGALLMGPDGAFITGSDFLMDGGVTAA